MITQLVLDHVADLGRLSYQKGLPRELTALRNDDRPNSIRDWWLYGWDKAKQADEKEKAERRKQAYATFLQHIDSATSIEELRACLRMLVDLIDEVKP